MPASLKSEAKIFHTPKFFLNSSSPENRKETKVASRIGMLVGYTPALAASLGSLTILSNPGSKCLLLSSALSRLHFFKRVFEVLFIHSYSGSMMIDSVVFISFTYCTTSIIMIYAQYLCQEVAEPVIDSKYPGVALFLVGIIGNFYHHTIFFRD
ncbi:uncharacterized protein A4U43_C01F33810 [Asparagus officinalis]|uniref:Uncharacterized protein n=1 Tax=Asparagus officinalis TaxID=4686 RepID=A0A5P1FXH4_ASPOF|nr:uncharacterized protein A4U43_C01F33810 [Asparagus officinalis]